MRQENNINNAKNIEKLNGIEKEMKEMCVKSKEKSENFISDKNITETQQLIVDQTVHVATRNSNNKPLTNVGSKTNDENNTMVYNNNNTTHSATASNSSSTEQIKNEMKDITDIGSNDIEERQAEQVIMEIENLIQQTKECVPEATITFGECLPRLYSDKLHTKEYNKRGHILNLELSELCKETDCHFIKYNYISPDHFRDGIGYGIAILVSCMKRVINPLIDVKSGDRRDQKILGSDYRKVPNYGQKGVQYMHKNYQAHTDNFENIPKEYWNVLKAIKKKPNIEEYIPEILMNENIIIKHFQDQGTPASYDKPFVNKLERELNILEDITELNMETDAPITFAEDIKDVNKILKKRYKVKNEKKRYEDLIETKFENIDDKSKFYLYKKT
ncbi:unnamed protein product [Mytilus coruscus]|uniref:Uncharacterized protein n=1 Tax=Mytilus coruscus TaxID=42192 RepID=A0A6J8CGR9_MYTCO|nr:unnamed protein product [Mytilus coruscus]